VTAAATAVILIPGRIGLQYSTPHGRYDVWIDAGPPGSEDPEEALEWTLELPDGRVYESPGNFFHNLLEPTLWGTNPEFTGLKVDMDGDGEISVGEALPEANMLLGATQGLNEATIEMQGAIEAWKPTLEDALTALVTMIPTMNEYFGQWKESVHMLNLYADFNRICPAMQRWLFFCSTGLDQSRSYCARKEKAIFTSQRIRPQKPGGEPRTACARQSDFSVDGASCRRKVCPIGRNRPALAGCGCSPMV